VPIRVLETLRFEAANRTASCLLSIGGVTGFNCRSSLPGQTRYDSRRTWPRLGARNPEYRLITEISASAGAVDGFHGRNAWLVPGGVSRQQLQAHTEHTI